jgi:hypothetical protein
VKKFLDAREDVSRTSLRGAGGKLYVDYAGFLFSVDVDPPVAEEDAAALATKVESDTLHSYLQTVGLRHNAWAGAYRDEYGNSEFYGEERESGGGERERESGEEKER